MPVPVPCVAGLQVSRASAPACAYEDACHCISVGNAMAANRPSVRMLRMAACLARRARDVAVPGSAT